MTALVGLPPLLIDVCRIVLANIDVREALADPLTPPVVLLAGAWVGCAVWAWLVYATVADLVERCRRRPRHRARLPVPRLPVPLHAAVTGLTGSVVLLVNSIAGHLSGAPGAATPPVSAPTLDHQPASPTSASAEPPSTLAVFASTTAPDRSSRTDSASPTPDAYTVKRGDTLSRIAQRTLGDPERWSEICTLNWHHHWPDPGGTLHNCNLIYPGWTLQLPATATPPVRPPAPPVSGPPPSPSTPSSTSEPATPPSTPATPPTTTVPDDPDGVINPPAPTRSAPAPWGSRPTPSAPGPSVAGPGAEPGTPGGRPTSSDHEGVHLSGGFVPWALAGALTAAAAMVWLQRRRRLLNSDTTADDAALPSPPVLPEPVAELQRQVVRHPDLVASDLHSDPAVPADAAERAAAVPAQPPLPGGGVGLVGDGAPDAARAALIATLAAGGPRDPDRCAEVIIDRDTVQLLLGSDSSALDRWPRLHITDDPREALAALDSRLLHRARILDEHRLTDLNSLREHAPDEEALPPLLLIGPVPPPDAHLTARASLALGAGLDLTALLLGAWPHGCTIDVAADGHTTVIDGTPQPPMPDRIGVLDIDAATAILATLREAHTGEPPAQPAPAAQRTATGPAAAEAGPPPVPDGHEPPSPTARLRVLGFPRVEDITRPGRPLRGKAAELAVYLACHPDGADTRTIGEHLAPDFRLRQADQQVHTNASNLRHVLGRAGGPRPGGYVLKRGTNARYRLDPDTVQVDLWQLRDLLTRAQLASGPTRTDMLRTACQLCTAPLAEGCDYDWVEPHREKARQWAIQAHLLLAGDLLATNPQAASDLLDQAIGVDRYNEELYRKAMHARHALTDTDGITALLRALTKALADLDAEPEQATIELAARLRADLEQP
jgi:hypothetical protein